MGKSPNIVKLWKEKNGSGQNKLTVPKPLAAVLNLQGGEVVEWHVRGPRTLEATFYP